jgi:hypothetical protein
MGQKQQGSRSNRNWNSNILQHRVLVIRQDSYGEYDEKLIREFGEFDVTCMNYQQHSKTNTSIPFHEYKAVILCTRPYELLFEQLRELIEEGRIGVHFLTSDQGNLVKLRFCEFTTAIHDYDMRISFPDLTRQHPILQDLFAEHPKLKTGEHQVSYQYCSLFRLSDLERTEFWDVLANTAQGPAMICHKKYKMSSGPWFTPFPGHDKKEKWTKDLLKFTLRWLCENRNGWNKQLLHSSIKKQAFSDVLIHSA